MEWFLYDNGPSHERVKYYVHLPDISHNQQFLVGKRKQVKVDGTHLYLNF